MATDAGTVSMKLAPIVRKAITLSVRVDGVRRFQCRAWLARQWLRIGARLIGCQFRIDRRRDDGMMVGDMDCEEST